MSLKLDELETPDLRKKNKQTEIYSAKRPICVRVYGGEKDCILINDGKISGRENNVFCSAWSNVVDKIQMKQLIVKIYK